MTESQLLAKLVEIDPYCDLMVTEPDSDGKRYYVAYLSIPFIERICPRCNKQDDTVLLDQDGEPYLCDSCWNEDD